jgi:hypothetical protein
MFATTDYRFLTDNILLELGLWAQADPTLDKRYYFASRDELLAYTYTLEAVGWELLSVTAGPGSFNCPHELPVEIWLFCHNLPS